MNVSSGGRILAFIAGAGTILAILTVIAAIVFAIFRLVASRHIQKPRKLDIILPLILWLLAAAAFILNIGWFRVFLIVFGIAPLHAILFLLSSFYSADVISESRAIRIYSIISYVTYPLSYMLLPDGGDYGGAYMFFSIIKNEVVVNIASVLVAPCFIASAVFIILQFIASLKFKKGKKRNEQTENL